jgi:hypothetical protein
MKTLHLISLAFFFLLTGTVYGQSTVDVVYLKNGSIIRGVIIEVVPNESLKIQTKDGSVFVYQMSEVAKMTKEIEQDANTSKAQRSTATGSDRTGYVNHTAMGFGLGLGNYNTEVVSNSFGTNQSEVKNEDVYFRLETVNGFWAGGGIMSIGMGLGIEYFTDSEIAQIPVFLDIRILPLVGNISPVLIMQGGYSIGVVGVDLGDDQIRYNGPQAAFGIGLHSKVTSGTALNAGLFYDWHQFNTSYRLMGWYGSDTVTEKLNGGFMRLSVGFTF